MQSVRFPYTDLERTRPGATPMPFLPLTLTYREQEISAMGLMDSGATVNVLPYSVGESLGFVWEEQRTALTLSGNLARFPSRGVIVSVAVAHFTPVRLAFAWTQSDVVPLLLGQTNFFQEFEVCFFRSLLAFEIKPNR